jgi:DNA polymerase-3 subunit alpha
MISLHSEEEIKNTQIVADMIEAYDILSKPQLPPFQCPRGFDQDEYLRELCRHGWRDKIMNVIPKEDQQPYLDRIKYELEVLQGAGLSSYFLIVQDIVNYVKNKRISSYTNKYYLYYIIIVLTSVQLWCSFKFFV